MLIGSLGGGNGSADGMALRTDALTADALFRPIVRPVRSVIIRRLAQNYFSITVEIETPPPPVWGVMTDVERWPEWTQSVSRVVRLSSGPLEVGSRVRVHQPKLPPAFWRVTELTPGVSFTWVSVVPGVRVTARHTVDAIAGGSRVTLSIQYQGLLGPLLARWTRHLNERYLAMEANGLKTRCADLAASHIREKHEPD